MATTLRIVLSKISDDIGAFNQKFHSFLSIAKNVSEKSLYAHKRGVYERHC